MACNQYESLLEDIDKKIISSISEDEILTLRSKRNSLVPISSLFANEILLEIFTHLAYDFQHEWKSSHSWLLPATHTCRLWREIALNCPRLWARLEYFSSYDAAKIFLRRSKSSELTVSFHERSKSWGITRELMLDQWHRIRKFSVVASLSHAYLWWPIHTYIQQFTPCLEELNLHVLEGPARFQQINPVRGYLQDIPSIRSLPWTVSTTAPNLKTLSLSGVYTTWTNLAFPNLINLTLHRIRVNTVTITEMLGLLERCPRLEVLHINKSMECDEKFTAFGGVNLQALRTLEVIDIPLKTCKALLSNLNFKQNIQWTIQCFDYPIEQPVAFIENLLHQSSSCNNFHLIIDSRQIIVELKSNSHSYNLGRLGLCWRLQAGSQAILRSLEVILGYEYLHSARKVFVNLNYDDESCLAQEKAWLELFEIVPNVNSLEVHFSASVNERVPTMQGSFVSALTKPCCSRSFLFPRYPLSRLISLTLIGANFSEQKSSFAAGLVEVVEKRSQYCQRLSKLKITNAAGITEEQVAMLRHFVNIVEPINSPFI